MAQNLAETWIWSLPQNYGASDRRHHCMAFFSQVGNELILSPIKFWDPNHPQAALDQRAYFELGKGQMAEIVIEWMRSPPPNPQPKIVTARTEPQLSHSSDH